MKAEILCVGTELLLGDIVNTNAQYISKELANIGIEVYHHSVIGDNENRLLKELERAFNYCDLVITTGGLGPTKDDLTKESVAKFFQEDLVLHEKSLKQIEKRLSCFNKSMTESNKKQAYFPKNCEILENPNGTAPGLIIEKDNKIAIILPGPPYEMQPMFENKVIPYLEKLTNSTIKSKVLRITGIGESDVADLISDILESQTNPTVAPYAKQGETTLRITAKANSEEKALNLIVPIEKKIRQTLEDNIYGSGETSLEEVVANILVKRNLTIATAESCTGGLLAGKLINFPGISSVFLEGAITYSNESKINRLNVKKETLEKYTAVSKEVALEMAEGIAKSAGTNIGISTTGVAGPGGGTYDKPIGLIYIGLYINGKTFVKELNYSGNRQFIRNITVTRALDFLRRNLK
ncbi:competence/damage-inducible protein A [Clostridium botulinum]|uniref:competence/damage-inducible protein A n=1 Tax=Clostridium botulinum TaxID=1491 RepID=UPI0001F85108|nr:competence/damage-inducible protein A [Clostridium botulinum]NFB17549.1 competence/damage-inducible protein A [Clostridium botulinum]NFB66690.1 competence/damage-inducible protein A [Clostridium botulinum]NFB97833.1 competence/damage-inducible protein A [Clostridium botulinum]NFC46672.1 competence/damage-inducible protein A [Clostridium botulinum]NFC56969.1 competence/damage-inducible protein A [Clostridium botulinum]